MVNEVDEIISLLDAFKPQDEEDNAERLYRLLEGFDQIQNRGKAMSAMFALLERFPEADFGSPGPIVHELEAMADYQPLLRDSLSRQPTSLTVWMVNRIINSSKDPSDHDSWLQTLDEVMRNPQSSEIVRDSAREFIDYQK